MPHHNLINRAKQLTIVPLNDGTTVHLAPDEKVTVKEFQVIGNQRLRKLVDLKVVAVDPPLGGPAGKPAKGKRPRRARKVPPQP